MAIGSFLYFELIKELGLKGKYAAIIGLSLLAIAILKTLLMDQTADLFSIISLSKKGSYRSGTTL